MSLGEIPHRRFNPLTGEWVLVSPHRTQRPWQGQVEDEVHFEAPRYDPGCYLCPGNARARGVKNPDYADTFVFTNDFAALLPDGPDLSLQQGELIEAHAERGICRVVCFSPDHSLTLSLMEHDDIVQVVQTWIDEYRTLGERDFVNHVQIFENRGQMMGCSNPHPHGQIWANESVPTLPALEHQKQLDYLERHSSCLLCDYVQVEQQNGQRIVFENEGFVCLVPFWAVWPFETMILPRAHLTDIGRMNDKQKRWLAVAIRHIGILYDNLFRTSFPYSMGIHQSPTDGGLHSQWHFHLHYYPPLLRSATVKKFMVGYELLAMPQRDITPEQSAQRLRSCSNNHYLMQKR